MNGLKVDVFHSYIEAKARMQVKVLSLYPMIDYTIAGHTIHGVLYFDATRALVNFSSDVRPGLAPDGKTLIQQRWSTPLTGYRAYGAFRLASHGDARYAPHAITAPVGQQARLRSPFNQ